ncbi:MAG TPA: 2Fe-2S iron-sulfur cluster-binding protein [Patescibacteria group bacterium]|nr:2Fe-2S iron-sulfur cluster-binding protein [Patescibacteria group bacterium]
MNIIIDDKTCPAMAGEMLLTVARRNNIHIPTLCHSDALPGQATCRLCIVEVVEKGRAKVVTSCVYPVTQPMEVHTHSPKILALRRTIIKLLAARAPHSEDIQQLMEEYQITIPRRLHGSSTESCVLCGLCVKACEKLGLTAIATVGRGTGKKISTPYDEPADDCVGCGTCAQNCPTGAIPIEEQPTRRTIWGKSFELLSCSVCGHAFTTREQWEHIRRQVPGISDTPVCESCRKQQLCAQLRRGHQ